MQALELKIPPLALVVIFGALMGLAAWLSPPLNLPTWMIMLNTGALALLGCVVALAGVISFRRAKTTVNPLQPDASSSLVSTGIYRYSRNPMYVGFLCWLLAWGVFLNSGLALLLALGFIPYMNRFQIVPEEQALQQLFGDSFTQYRKHVRRWL